MIPLPYADDLRGNKEIVEYAGLGRKNEGGAGIAETLTDTEKHAAKLLIKNLNIDFDSRNFQNPTIQKFFSGL
jgi:ATP-dependent DNA helicase 2 subunit 1